jgi:hypothetical protein
VIILAHTRELVEQNANACRMLGPCRSASTPRLWRTDMARAGHLCGNPVGPQVRKPIRNCHAVKGDEAHLWPHSEDGHVSPIPCAGFPDVRAGGYSGTTFRLKGGSLVDGENAPFKSSCYRYSAFIDGIRDGYLVPAFSAGAVDKMDTTKLRTSSRASTTAKAKTRR